MAWRLAKSLARWRGQRNRAALHRSKASDEIIRDEAHPLRAVAYHAWVRDGAVGVVTALDITRDPFNGWIMYL
jgi:hypothetical protein